MQYLSTIYINLTGVYFGDQQTKAGGPDPVYDLFLLGQAKNDFYILYGCLKKKKGRQEYFVETILFTIHK